LSPLAHTIFVHRTGEMEPVRKSAGELGRKQRGFADLGCWGKQLLLSLFTAEPDFLLVRLVEGGCRSQLCA
jgi:hypothetical protein